MHDFYGKLPAAQKAQLIDSSPIIEMSIREARMLIDYMPEGTEKDIVNGDELASAIDQEQGYAAQTGEPRYVVLRIVP